MNNLPDTDHDDLLVLPDHELSIDIVKAVENDINESGAISENNLISLENIKPGIVTDLVLNPTRKLTPRDKQDVLVALEDYKKMLIGGIIGAVLGFLLKLLFSEESEKKPRSSSEVAKINEDATKAEEEAKKAADEAAGEVRSSHTVLDDKTRDKIVGYIKTHTKHSEDEARRIASSDIEIKKYFFDSDMFILDVIVKHLENKIPVIIGTKEMAKEQHALVALIKALHTHANQRIDHTKRLIDHYEQIGGSAQWLNNPAANIPTVFTDDINSIVTFIGDQSLKDSPHNEIGHKLEEKIKELFKTIDGNTLNDYGKKTDQILGFYTPEFENIIELCHEYAQPFKPEISRMKIYYERVIKRNIEPDVNGQYQKNVTIRRDTRTLNQDLVAHKKIIESEFLLMKSLVAVGELVKLRMDKLSDHIKKHEENMIRAGKFINEVRQHYINPVNI